MSQDIYQGQCSMMTDGVDEVTENIANLHLDPETKEMVSKSYTLTTIHLVFII